MASLDLELITYKNKYSWRFLLNRCLYEIRIQKGLWEYQETCHHYQSSAKELAHCGLLQTNKRVELFMIADKSGEFTSKKVDHRSYYFASYRTIDAAVNAAKRHADNFK